MSLTSITLLIVLLSISFLIVVVLVVLEHKKTDKAKGLMIKGSFEEHDSLEENNIDQQSIYECSKSGDLECVVHWLNVKHDINKRDDSGFAPLHLTCLHGKTEIVQQLIDRGANVNLLSEKDLLSPMACLAQGRANLNFNEGTFYKIVSILKKAGGSINRTKDEATPPVKAAIVHGDLDLLDFFMSVHVHIFVEDTDKRSMLHHCSLNPNSNSISVLRRLIDRGLDINGQDSDGNTPLHLALNPFNREIAEYLISAGADEEIKNWKGISSKKIVQQNIVNFLRQP